MSHSIQDTLPMRLVDRLTFALTLGKLFVLVFRDWDRWFIVHTVYLECPSAIRHFFLKVFPSKKQAK